MTTLTANSSLEHQPRPSPQLTCPYLTCHSLLRCTPNLTMARPFTHWAVLTARKAVSITLILQMKTVNPGSGHLFKVRQLDTA